MSLLTTTIETQKAPDWVLARHRFTKAEDWKQLGAGGIGIVDAGRYTVVICDNEESTGEHVAKSAGYMRNFAQRRSA